MGAANQQPGPSPGTRGLFWGISWLAGVALQLQQPALWAQSAVALLAAAALLVAAAAWRWRRAWAGAVVLSSACLALAFASTSQRAALLLADALPPALEGQDLLVTGVVAQMPRLGASGTRFVFAVETALHRGQTVQIPASVSLGWYRGFDSDASQSGPPPSLGAGQRWQFTVRLKQPHGSFNPHGFDLELWLFEQGLRAGGSVRDTRGNPAVMLADGVGCHVERARQAVRDAILRQVPDARAAGVLAALVVGDQAAITRDDWDLFRTTGVAHLMSISGLHVTMFAWAAGLAVAWAWRRSPRLMLAVPVPLAARWGGLALAAAYALLAGWGVPAQRTVWMIAAVALLRTLGLRWPLLLVLLLAGLVVVLADPWALLQPGFWLSFVAVALLVSSEPAAGREPIVATASRLQRLRHTLQGGLRTQLVASIGLAPLSMVFFQQVSIVGLLANLVAIPAVTLLITPLGLLGVLLSPLWLLGAWLVQWLSALLQFFAGWPLAVWTAAAAPPWAAACGLLAAVLAVQRPSPGTFELVAADVGQGTAVLVRTAHHLLVYDTGPAYTPESDAGGRVLLPLLRARGEASVDLLMLSHRDTDHVGGAASLMGGIAVKALSSSLEGSHPLLQRGLPHTPCTAGQHWQWDGVQFEVLHPLATAHAVAATTRPNALSCVLRIQGRQRSVLLTGDIEAAQEAALVARAGTELRSDVLLVPHHGSRTSSTPAFLDTVAPHTAVAQAAYRSRFGHPAPPVVARYTERGVQFVQSDRCGAWTLYADGNTRCERIAARRYWHHPGLAAPAPAPAPALALPPDMPP